MSTFTIFWNLDLAQVRQDEISTAYLKNREKEKWRGLRKGLQLERGQHKVVGPGTELWCGGT